MDRSRFEALIAEGFEMLPMRIREKIRNVALLMEDEPSEQDRTAQGLAPHETLLGLYKGVPLSERGESYGVGVFMPDTITLYRLPIQEAAAEERMPYEEAVRKVIAETIWHEFAHHFGMSEQEVQSWERARWGE